MKCPRDMEVTLRCLTTSPLANEIAASEKLVRSVVVRGDSANILLAPSNE